MGREAHSGHHNFQTAPELCSHQCRMLPSICTHTAAAFGRYRHHISWREFVTSLDNSYFSVPNYCFRFYFAFLFQTDCRTFRRISSPLELSESAIFLFIQYHWKMGELLGVMWTWNVMSKTGMASRGWMAFQTASAIQNEQQRKCKEMVV